MHFNPGSISSTDRVSLTQCPVYNPATAERECYPQLGHKLTTEHVGKLVVRVCPLVDPKNRRDWSFCFYQKSPLNYAVKVQAVTAVGLSILAPDAVTKQLVDKHTLDKHWNDDHWLTLDEFRAELAKNPQLYSLPVHYAENQQPKLVKVKLMPN